MTKINQVIQMELVIILIIWLALGAMTAYLANQKGRDPFLWSTGVLIISLFGLPLAVMALAFLMFLPAVDEENEPQERDFVEAPPAPPEKTVNEVFSQIWFFYDPAHQQQGPLSFEGMRTAWRDGSLTADSYVWTEGFDAWKKAGNVPELIDALTGIPSETIKKM